MESEAQVLVDSAADIVAARQKVRSLAGELGFEGSELTMIATAISEIARNIVDHAKQGTITIQPLESGGRRGLEIIARDAGPGIANLTLAMQYGYSTRSGLGVGLPGAKWLMDEFDIASQPGRGTVITMRKWLK